MYVLKCLVHQWTVVVGCRTSESSKINEVLFPSVALFGTGPRELDSPLNCVLFLSLEGLLSAKGFVMINYWFTLVGKARRTDNARQATLMRNRSSLAPGANTQPWVGVEALEERTFLSISLTFPIDGMTAYTAPIVSAFDHSGPRYQPGQGVMTFSGESGTTVNPNEPAVKLGSYTLASFYKKGGGNFTLNAANYVGTGTTHESTINYDGHPGYDYNVGKGTPVKAAAAGDIEIVPADAGAGIYIRIQHADGYETQYLHLSKVNVTPGTHVLTGALIGWSGDTGAAAGHPHLHFEVKKNGVSVDPYGWEGPSGSVDPYTVSHPGVVNAHLWVAAVTVAKPNPVTNLAAAAASSTSIKLTWALNNPGTSKETSLKVMKWNGSGWAAILTLNAGTTTFTDTGLAPSTTSYYYIVAVNSAGEAWSANYVYATTTAAATATKPNPVTNLTWSRTSSTQILLSWTYNGSNATGFYLESWNGSAWTVFSTVSASIRSNAVKLGTGTYFLRVTAYNSAGKTPTANYVTIVN